MKLTGSKIELADTCLGSVVHEHVGGSTIFSEIGTAKHRFLFDTLNFGREEALKLVEKKNLEACELLDTSKLPAAQRGRWAGEVAFALDVETGCARELGRNLERRYDEAGLQPTEIAGTIDLMGMTEDSEGIAAVDYKCGWARVTRGQENLQLLFAAVCATEVYGRSRAVGAILYPGDDGEDPYFDTGEWDAFDLVDAKERIIAIGRAALEAERLFRDGDPKTGEVKKPRLVVGRHCRYCPALSTCPAQGALVRRFMATPEETGHDLKRQLADNDTAALVYRRIIAVEQAISQMKTIIYARASQSPIALGNGRVLGRVESRREELKPEIVFDVVEEMFGPGSGKIACEIEASKASVKRLAAALKRKEGGTISKREAAVLDAVRARGGVIVSVTKTVKEYTHAAPALPEGDTPS